MSAVKMYTHFSSPNCGTNAAVSSTSKLIQNIHPSELSSINKKVKISDSGVR